MGQTFSCQGNRGIDHGKSFAEATLRLLPAFIADAKALAEHDYAKEKET